MSWSLLMKLKIELNNSIQLFIYQRKQVMKTKEIKIKRVNQKSVVNSKLKESVFSCSGLIRHINGNPDAKKHVEKYLKELAEKHGTIVSIKQINTLTISVYGSERELTIIKTGEKRSQFSFWTLLNCITRQVKDAASGGLIMKEHKAAKAKKASKETKDNKAA